MFFIGIFGIDIKEKYLKEINEFQCKGCTQFVKGKLIKRFSFFHLFFIPIIKWNEHYYIICENCKNIYEVPKEKGKALERGEDQPITYWDLKSVVNHKICSNCGNEINDGYIYCPYCGTEIKG